MSIRVVRLGSPRSSSEGVRLGTVRHPPRGVPKGDLSRRDFFDVWLPELAPSAELLHWARSEAYISNRWSTFERRYRREMKEPSARHLIAMLSTLARNTNFSVGCYCEDEQHCHRSILRELLVEQGADVVS